MREAPPRRLMTHPHSTAKGGIMSTEDNIRKSTENLDKAAGSAPSNEFLDKVDTTDFGTNDEAEETESEDDEHTEGDRTAADEGSGERSTGDTSDDDEDDGERRG